MHLVIHLIAWVDIELEVGAHGRLKRPIESLLDLPTDIFVVVPGAQLFVELVVGGSVKAFNLGGGSCGLGRRRLRLPGFTSVNGNEIWL